MGLVLRGQSGRWLSNRARLAAAQARLSNSFLTRPANIDPATWEQTLLARERWAAVTASLRSGER